MADIGAEVGVGRTDLERWFAVPTTILCESRDVFDWCTSLAGGVQDKRAATIVICRAFTPQQLAMEKLRAIQSSKASYIHFRGSGFLYDPLSMELIARTLGAQKPELASMDATIRTGPVHELSASWLLRRHQISSLDGGIPGRPRTMAESLVSIDLARRQSALFSVAPTDDDWGRLVLRHLRRAARDDLHIPLLAGATLPRRRSKTRAEAGVLALGLLEVELQDLLAGELSIGLHVAGLAPVSFDNSLSRRITGLHALKLAHSLPKDVGDFVRSIIAAALGELIDQSRSDLFSNMSGALSFMGELSDVLGLMAFDSLEILPEDCLQVMVNRMAEEVVVGSDRILSLLLARLVPGDESAEARADPVGRVKLRYQDLGALLRHAGTIEREMRTWRAECGRQMELLSAERKRGRTLLENNKKLRQRVEVGQIPDRARPAAAE